MELLYPVGFALLIQLFRVGYFYYEKRQVKIAEIEIADFKWETYIKERDKLLATKAADLNIEIDGSDEVSYGLAQEAHYGTDVSITAIFGNSTIKFLTSSTAKTQLFKDEDLKAEVTALLKKSNYHFARMRRHNTAIPQPGYIKFYVLTNYDIYAVQSRFADIIDHNSDWRELLEGIDEIVMLAAKLDA